MLATCMALIDEEENKKSFEELYDKYKVKVYSCAYRILRNETLSEDATSEAFLQIAKSFQKIHNFNVHKLDAYIVITIRNVSFNMLKREKQHMNNFTLDDKKDIAVNFTEDDLGYQTVRKCIDTLDESDRDILYLRMVSGLSYTKIAETYGIRVNTARKRISNARRKLKILLDKEDIGK